METKILSKKQEQVLEKIEKIKKFIELKSDNIEIVFKTKANFNKFFDYFLSDDLFRVIIEFTNNNLTNNITEKDLKRQEIEEISNNLRKIKLIDVYMDSPIEKIFRFHYNKKEFTKYHTINLQVRYLSHTKEDEAQIISLMEKDAEPYSPIAWLDEYQRIEYKYDKEDCEKLNNEKDDAKKIEILKSLIWDKHLGEAKKIYNDEIKKLYPNREVYYDVGYRYFCIVFRTSINEKTYQWDTMIKLN